MSDCGCVIETMSEISLSDDEEEEIPETPYEQVMEELLYDLIIDLIRQYLYDMIELPVDGFSSHAEWYDFNDVILDFIRDLFTFFVHHGSQLIEVDSDRFYENLNTLHDIAAAIARVMDDNVWLNPLVDQDLDIYERNMDSKINKLR